ncbi:GGDEF domain-containing protein [Mycobacterium deserti]|uniref:GGDEF domain-containing protein n=1 Tax=Mycobacterium deserti TaxID=2978347 RepID=A0ABT2MHG8_9MYCO|nr:GGDEF domain-containing protein [Mycobacterium deserti]MCT7661730.1 GGDEF domain-containing protein [Mycobacterium deserti]
MPRFTDWLAEPDQFESVTKFLRQRELLRPTRVLMALVTTSSALVPLSVLARSDQLASTEVTVGVAGAALSAVMTWFWLTRWPTRRQSLVSVILGTVAVSAWSLTQPSAWGAALACTAGAVTGGYIGFFHSSRVLVFNIAVALGTAVLVGHRLARETDLTTALAAFWLVWLLNIAVPLGIRGTSKAMSRYAARSDEDPLTGLLNRRGFVDAGRRLIAGMAKSDHGFVLVIMVDLDDFKRVNDTYGHAAGDRTLMQVADLLREHAPAGVPICRSGGEEFIVAFTSVSHDAASLTTSLCQAIKRRCNNVSASIGVAYAERSDILHDDVADSIDQLVDAADLAMYEAKRKGGNRVELAPRYEKYSREPIN